MNDGLGYKQRLTKKFCDMMMECGIDFSFRQEKISDNICDIVTFSTNDKKKIEFVVANNNEGWFDVNNDNKREKNK